MSNPVINSSISQTTITQIICDIEALLKRARIPYRSPVRFELTSPYTTSNYTQKQLDMRRKVEILQYKSNNQNTKQNGITKKQLFSKIINNPSVASTINSKWINNVCDLNNISVPTSSSDVPGPIEYLYLDPNVPLYNYNIRRNYNLYLQEDTVEWNAIINTDITNNNTSIISLYVRDSITSVYSTYEINIPIFIKLSGKNNVNSDYNLDFTRNQVNIQITSVILTIKFNNTIIQTITQKNFQSNISFKTHQLDPDNFSATFFIGNFTTSVLLYTQPNIIYDFYISLSTKLVITNLDFTLNDYFENITTSEIINPSNTATESNNCTINTNEGYTPCTITDNKYI
jgi:hypothetical protein